MPDGRFLSKSIAWSEQVGSVSLAADYVFMRMIPHLDREGRIGGSPKAVKAMCCPLRDELTPEAVEHALSELAAVGLIQWYTVRDQSYIQFPGFATHQRGARLEREAPSRLPAPQDGAQVSLRIHSAVTPDSLRVSEVKESQVKSSEEYAASNGDAACVPSLEPKPAKRIRHEYPPDFEAFWATFPKDGRLEKPKAFKAWRRRIAEGHTPPIIMAGLERYKLYIAATGQYPKYAGTFLGPDLCFLEAWEPPASRTAPAQAIKPWEQAELDAGARKARIANVQTRRARSDGDLWWERMQREGESQGLNAAQIYDYAYTRIEESAEPLRIVR